MMLPLLSSTGFAENRDQVGALLPKVWQADSLELLYGERADDWWRLFGDSALDTLIARGAEGNYSLKGSMKRIQASQMALKGMRSGYMPNIGLSAGWTAMRSSGKTTAHYIEEETIKYFSAGLDMSWEIDVFGRVAAQMKGGKAEVKVSRADFEGALLSVKASMADSYFALCLARCQRAVAESQLESQRKILNITEVRKETGLSSGLDVAQAATTVLSTEATIPALKASEQSAINSMAVLAATTPDEIGRILGADGGRALPPLPKSLPVGLPADMIGERPDIAAARAEIDAAASKLGIARKEWLPTLAVEASAGTTATKIKDLFSSGSFEWQVAPKLSWTVFDGLSRNYANAEARINLEAAVDSYNETVMTAWGEVENALAQYESALERMKCEEALLVQAEKTFDYSLDLYKQGLVDFTNVQNAQVSCLDARNSILTAHYDALTTLVNLFKSLGVHGAE